VLTADAVVRVAIIRRGFSGVELSISQSGAEAESAKMAVSETFACKSLWLLA